MDSLWKKDASGLYKDIFANINRVEMLPGISHNQFCIALGVTQNKKQNEVSMKCRQAGNTKVNEKNWHDAMLLYNRSLCFAEEDTENVTLAYANRSLCFLKMEMYDKCLIDIEMAINAKYPERLMSKLEDRRAYCLKHTNKTSFLPNETQKLDFEADEHFPGMANVLQMKYSKKFGRHFIAKCDIDVGKTVLVEEPFVKTTIFKQDFGICDSCFKNMTNFIPCPNCTSALFCSEDCANDLFHTLRCGRRSTSDNILVEFVLNSILRAGEIMCSIEEWMEFVENVVKEKNVEEVPLSIVDDKSKYRMFLKLNLWMTEENKKDHVDRANEVFDMLMRIQDIKDSFDTLKKMRFLMHLCIMHVNLVRCNSFHTEMYGGIFLIRNHLNHSCAPNILCSAFQNKSICISSRRIKKGDQLFISYGDTYWDPHPLHERQQNLWNDFGFQCKCEKCRNTNWPISSEKVQSDPDFQNIQADLWKEKFGYPDLAKCVSRKRTCLELLKKYSDLPWCTQLDLVSKGFQTACVESLF
ncbi:SET and MYND domain-containing protein 4-like isoform X2 [Contarinia nasturtii]|nr:SET and MYND domain-containing protein 4-like isoform X2 [Contarinia nasturtii]